MLSSAINIHDVFQTIVRSDLEITNTPAGRLALYDAEKNELELTAVYGFSPEFSLKATRWKVRPGGLTSRILSQFDYITKPLDTDEVCESIRRSLEVRILSRELNAPEKPPSILVVDDMQSALFLSESILQDEGYHVEIAQNGQEVLERLKQKHFDIVIADLHMPGMDGIELLNNIKKLVIIMTARIGKTLYRGKYR